MVPTIGRIVHYRLNELDVLRVNGRRQDFRARQCAAGAPSTGFVAHVGNDVRVGDVFPAMVVRVFEPSHGEVNLQVFLDGNDTLWVTSSVEGMGDGQWFWPPRPGADSGDPLRIEGKGLRTLDEVRTEFGVPPVR